MHILCIDRGSSSLKIAVYEIGDGVERRILEGGVDRLGVSGVALSVRDYRETETKAARKVLDGAEPVAAVLPLLRELGLEIDAVGHRIVFGGPALEEPTRVTDELLTSLTALVPFDRLHLPAALAAIREIEAAQPRLPQVVCFDTAFHHRMPTVAQRLRSWATAAFAAGRSSHTWGAGRAWPRFATAARWTRRWVSPRSAAS